MPNGQAAFELLLEMDLQSRQSRQVAEQQLHSSGHSQYVRFRVAGYVLLTKVSSVTEILPVPPITTVPFTKSWMIGVSNIRGDVIPVADFSAFLFNQGVKKTKKNKLIILKGNGFQTSILVDEILGMSDLAQDDIHHVTEDLDQRLQPFVGGIYAKEDQEYLVMNTQALLSEPGFMKAAN